MTSTQARKEKLNLNVISGSFWVWFEKFEHSIEIYKEFGRFRYSYSFEQMLVKNNRKNGRKFFENL